MTDLRALLAFAAYLVYALVLVTRGVKSAIAPFCAVGGGILLFGLLGCVGLLPLAGWLFYLGAAAGLLYLIVYAVVQKRPLGKLSFGFWFFVVASLWCILSFWVRQPMFTTWDEFSFWGTAVKLAKLYGELYTTAPVGWPWPSTFPPAMVSLGYSVQFLGAGFAEWQVYAAYNMLSFSVIALLLAPFGKRHWNIALPLAVVGFLTPYIFILYSAQNAMTHIYLDSLSDPILGLLFGGALLLYFSAKERNLSAMLPVGLALALLVWTKDTGLAFALVAAVLILLDMLFARRPVGMRRSQQNIGALLRFGGLLACILLPFQIWSMHLQATAGVSRTELGGTQNLSMMQLPVVFLREVLSTEKSEQFTTVMAGLPRLFATERTTMLGSGLVVSVFILALLAFAALITKQAAQRRRCVIFAVFSLLGFAAYLLLIGLTYIYIFRPEQIFSSYERYLYPYYIGWFLAAAGLLGISAKDSRFVIEGKAAILALCGIFCLRFAQFVPVGYSVLGFHKEDYAQRRAFSASAQQVAAQLPEGSLTFIVSQNDNGNKWFTYCYELLPRQVDFSFGGGTIALPGALPEGDYYYPTTPEQLQSYMTEKGITHLFLDDVNQLFEKGYSPLFTDGLAAYTAGETVLYEVVEGTDGVRFQPYYAGEVAP